MSEVTCTSWPPAADFRRTGSNHTAMPAANGTAVMMIPMTFAAIFFKNPRRSGQLGHSCCIRIQHVRAVLRMAHRRENQFKRQKVLEAGKRADFSSAKK